jgi:fused signal recognition particle receptor
MGIFSKFFNGVAKTANKITTGISSIFTGKELDDDFYDDLTALLLSADMGTEASEKIIGDIKKTAKKHDIKTEQDLKKALSKSIADILDFTPVGIDAPTVLLIVGVNGVGKTTTIGKLAAYFKAQKKSVLLAAGDTFRAAAGEQLYEWAKRSDTRIVKHDEGADPASVIFDALTSAKAKNTDITIIDTAGRLHNKAHLMEELKKVDRIIARVYPEANYKKFIVLDATTGQNAINQVQIFNEAVNLDGAVLTKLDGTAKGGVIVAIKQKFNLPVIYIGVGEKIDDLLPFDAREFADTITGIGK